MCCMETAVTVCFRTFSVVDSGLLMDLETMDALARVVILAWSYVEQHPQAGEANEEAVTRVLEWLRSQENLPVGWEQREGISRALSLLQ